MPQVGLRERKKLLTRNVLEAAGIQLFLKQGYHETSLEQIADEAMVSIRTLLRYFESKEKLALATYQKLVDQFENDVSDPQRETTTLDCWRAHIAGWEHGDFGVTKKFLDFFFAEPSLRAGMEVIQDKYEDLITANLAKDLGSGPTLSNRMVAVMLVRGSSSVARQWSATGGKGDVWKMCLGVADFVAERFPEVVTDVKR